MRNQGCLNAMWHFPFFGFLTAFYYAVVGVIVCCTIIFIPLGISYFQIAKFMMSPFSREMVSRKDLALFNPNIEKEGVLFSILSTIDKILCFPFGLVMSFASCIQMLCCFISLIGIPVGMVYWKMLPTIFNPIGKVCVPKEVADEIVKLKSSSTLDDYKSKNGIVDSKA